MATARERGSLGSSPNVTRPSGARLSLSSPPPHPSILHEQWSTKEHTLSHTHSLTHTHTNTHTHTHTHTHKSVWSETSIPHSTHTHKTPESSVNSYHHHTHLTVHPTHRLSGVWFVWGKVRWCVPIPTAV